MAIARTLPNGVEPVGKTKTKSGKNEYSFSVLCPKCKRLRIVRRRQHAIAMSAKICKRCSNKNNHPAGEIGEVRHSFFNKFYVGAVQRSKAWNLTIEEAAHILKQQDFKCALTGLQIHANGPLESITASLDRKDNSKGYSVENIQWTHKEINMMRGTLSIERFIELCKLTATKMVA